MLADKFCYIPKFSSSYTTSFHIYFLHNYKRKRVDIDEKINVYCCVNGISNFMFYLELNLIADDFLDSVVCAEDDHYYYINTDNNLVDENGKVIFENVFGVSNNEYGSNYLTIYR